jgi:hypothetical protein
MISVISGRAKREPGIQQQCKLLDSGFARKTRAPE